MQILKRWINPLVAETSFVFFCMLCIQKILKFCSVPTAIKGFKSTLFIKALAECVQQFV